MVTTDTTFIKTTTIFTVVLTALGTFGLITSPTQAWPLVLGVVFTLCGVVFYDKISVLNEHSAVLTKLKESILLEKRLNKIEQEISEHTGVLRTMLHNKKGDSDQNIVLFAIIVGFIYILYLIFFAKTPVTP